MGRPSKYSEDVVFEIVESLAVGATRTDAYTLAGITHTTFHRWLKDDKNGFRAAIAHAEARCKIMLHRCIVTAAIKKDWKAAAYMLERIDRRITGDSTIKTNTSKAEELTPDERVKLINELIGKK